MSNINANDLQQSIFDAVDTIVSRRIKEIDYDKTIIGIINSYAGVKNRKVIYKVEYAGGFFYASVLDNNDIYIKNMPVYVFVPQGDFSKDKIILGRANTINTSSNLNLVATAMNNYSILGRNILELTDSSTIEAGVRSYHSKNTEPNDPIKHRYNVLYNSNNNIEDNFVKIADRQSLLTYVQEGTAILIRADFRTDLSTEQKNMAAARYGLSFKLKFKNENAGWGETQGDILNNISQKISGEISRPDYFEPQTISLVNIVKQIEDIIKELKEDNFEDFISLDGIFSEQINLIEELYRVFVTNNPEDNLDIIEETLRAYVGLLKELQTYSTIESIQEGYVEWCETSVESEEFKILPCLLDSNKMTGSPLYFKKPVTQYAIFEADLSNFVGIEEIALFKENFNEDFSKDTKEDIFVQNIQFYILEPLDTVSGDYNLKVESLTTGPVLSRENNSVTFTATLSRKIYEDLSANINSYFYWFKEDPSVQIGTEGYDMYGGKGWRLLYSTKESKRTFRTTFDENPSKKNNYKCVAIYKENQDTNVVLECSFIVYNSSKGEIIELQSDLGTVFQFDVGTPTITCLISGQETNVKNNSLDEPIADYYFYWSLNTEDGQEILLYDENNEIDWSNLDIDSFSTYQMQDLYLKNIKFFKLDNDKVVETSNSLEATRLQYPMVNINTGSKATIKCTVVAVDRENKNRIVQGSGELVFENRKGAVLIGYRIVFEHDNQVFQYDEYGNSPALKTKLDPQEILPIRAKLVGPNGLEISETNIQVDWIFPLENTMVIPLNTLILNPEDGLQNLLKNSNNCSFLIDDQYNPDATNNQITCRIKYKNVNYYKDTNLFFRKIGENGTNGTDVTVRISPKSSATILNEQSLTLYTYPEENTTKGFLNDNSYISNNNILEEITLTGENGYLETEVYQKGTQINSDKYKLMWNLAGNPSESSNSKGNVFDINLDNPNLTNIIKWPIEDQKHSTKKTYRLQNIKSHVKMTDAANISKDYYGYYPLPIIEYVSEKPPIYANRRIAIDKKTYLKEITYNADGRNPIYNHNQGLKLVNLPIGSTVVWKAKGGWTIGENNPDFSLIFNKNDTAKDNHLMLSSVAKPTSDDWNNWEKNYQINLLNSYFDYVKKAVDCIEEYQNNWEIALNKKKQQEKEALEKITKIACCNEIITKVSDKKDGNLYELFISHLLDSNTIRIYSSQEEVDNHNYKVLKVTPRLRYSPINKLYYDYLYSVRDDNTGEYIPVKIEQTENSYGYHFINSDGSQGDYIEIIQPSFEEIKYGDRQYINFERWQIQEGKINETKESFWSLDYDWISNSLISEDIEELNKTENENDKKYFNYFKWGIEQADHSVLLPYWWFTENENIKWKNYTNDNELNSEAKNDEAFYWFGNKTQIFKEEYDKTLSTEYSDLFNKNIDNEKTLPKDSTIFYYSKVEDEDIKKILLDKNNEIKNFIQKYMILFNILDWTELFDKRYDNYIEKTSYPSFDEIFPKLEESSTVTILKEQANEAFIYIVPNDEASGSSTNNRIEAEIYVRDSKKNTNDLYAIVYAPIIVTLNTFGLASLNAWDGNSVTVDEEGGYIMAPQIGAGEKDSNNRFTGIVMGKTETYTGGGDKEKQVGLFGYAHGLQSIFLDSETGNATFGLPDVDSDFDENGNVVKKYQHTNINSGDDYNEGRIELRPGDVSKIGGWRLGRRSIYYIENDQDIGSKYNNDYIPDNTGAIKFGNRYNSHHEKDIQEDSAGILLHSGKYPYLSIKGKKLNIEEDQLSNSSLSYLLDGDSLEVQIDPYTPTLFTIFRHNGQTRYKDVEQTEVLYPAGSRTYLAGINSRGQLVANGLQNTTPTNNSGSDTVTTFGVNAVPAFGERSENASYIGLMMDAADQMISKIFVTNVEENRAIDSTLYITGSGSEYNEYTRPISLHGKEISLFASSNDSINKTTDANVQISNNTYQTQLGNTLFKLAREDENLLETNGTLRINLKNNDVYYPLIFNAGSSKIELYNGGTKYYSQTIKGSTQENDTTIPGGVSIETTYPNYSIKSQDIKINMSNNKLELSNINNYQNSILLNQDNGNWNVGHDLTLQNVNQLKIRTTNTGNASQYNSSDAHAQILIQAGGNPSNEEKPVNKSTNATKLYLNSSNNTWTHNENGISTQGNSLYSWFKVINTKRNSGIYLYDKGNETHFEMDVTDIGTTATADKLSFGTTDFSGSYGSGDSKITCNLGSKSNLEAVIEELANRIAQVAWAFNNHSHTFSTSSSKTVAWTAPKHTVLSSVNVTDTHERIIGHSQKDSTDVTIGVVNMGGGANWTITENSTSQFDSPNTSGSGYVDKIGEVRAIPSTKSVGGEKHSETVTLTVNQTLGVPSGQQIKDTNF